MTKVSLLVLLLISSETINSKEGQKNSYKCDRYSHPNLFTEYFDQIKHWVPSEHKQFNGKFDHYKDTHHLFNKTTINCYSIITTDDTKRYAISTKLKKNIEIKDKFIISYELRAHKTLRCGGGYLKLLKNDFDQKLFNETTPITIVFGPDKCGYLNRVQFVFNYLNNTSKKYKLHYLRNPPELPDDDLTHLYSLILDMKKNTYDILIDMKSKKKGSLLTDFQPNLKQEEMIVDVLDKKPDNWDDRELIEDKEIKKPKNWNKNEPELVEDPKDIKPKDWDENIQKMIPDPKAVQPEDWNESVDGIWEVPKIENPKCKKNKCGKWKARMIKNPKYQGKWTPPKIKNQNYRGKWKPRMIKNPHYVKFDKLKIDSVSGIGIEIWGLDGGLEYSNIMIGSDKEDVIKHLKENAKTSFDVKMKAEKIRKKIEINFSDIFKEMIINFKPIFINNPKFLFILFISPISLLLILYICLIKSKETIKVQSNKNEEKNNNLESEENQKSKDEEIVEENNNENILTNQSEEDIMSSEKENDTEEEEEPIRRRRNRRVD